MLKEEKKSALYNTLQGEIIHLCEERTRIIELLDKMPFEEILNIINGLSKTEIMEFVRVLKQNGIIRKYENKAYIDKLSLGFPLFMQKHLFNKPAPNLDIAFIEVSSTCDFSCYFCKNYPIKFGCLGCTQISYKKRISEELWLEILQEVNNLRCKTLVILGGDPFLEITSLVNFCRNLDKFNFENIFILTHGINIATKKSRNLIKHYNLKPIISIFLPSSLYNTISQKSFAFLLNNLRKLKEEDIQFYINFRFCDLESYKQKNIIIENMTTDLNINKQNISESYMFDHYIEKNDILPVFVSDFELRKIYNPCLKGKITITLEGKYLLCPMLRNLVLGSVKESKIPDLFIKGTIDRFYELSKEKLYPCKYCEFRYACLDCRAFELLKGSSLGEVKFCKYNPLEGIWG
ncbi:4Fe-4S cluster-binding domain-containing protein [Dictyoglomus thermophilum]|nr:4Fe-4S cluster-binding domain-containing protein [Dictyoglomus thermophilum]TYT20338.1 4Fe-4S cluster-binding domain-containing protein [Dictyoglomus thermophilum]